MAATRSTTRWRFAWLFGLVLLAACSDRQASEYAPTFADHTHDEEAIYLFGVHPLHNPQRLSEVFSPLMDHLSDAIPGARFKLDASRNYAAYEDKLRAHVHHFSLPNPYQTLMAIREGYRVFAKMGDDDNFRGILVVRRDSDIEQPTDLIGKSVSYPAATALAATMLPQYFLQTHGVDVQHDLSNQYVGSQESAIMNAFLGVSAAAATWPPPWQALVAERPELAQQMEVKWQTEPLINNAVVARQDVPQALVAQVRTVLRDLHMHDRGRGILAAMKLSRFEEADNARYAVVADFLTRFTDQVRPLP